MMELSLIKTHSKALNKQACNPYGYWSAEHAFTYLNQGKLALFNLDTRNTAANDNEWRLVA